MYAKGRQQQHSFCELHDTFRRQPSTLYPKQIAPERICEPHPTQFGRQAQAADAHTKHSPASHSVSVRSKSNSSRGGCASLTGSSIYTSRSAAAGLDGWGVALTLAARGCGCGCCFQMLSGKPWRLNQLSMSKRRVRTGRTSGVPARFCLQKGAATVQECSRVGMACEDGQARQLTTL